MRTHDDRGHALSVKLDASSFGTVEMDGKPLEHTYKLTLEAEAGCQPVVTILSRLSELTVGAEGVALRHISLCPGCQANPERTTAGEMTWNAYLASIRPPLRPTAVIGEDGQVDVPETERQFQLAQEQAERVLPPTWSELSEVQRKIWQTCLEHALLRMNGGE